MSLPIASMESDVSFQPHALPG